MLSKEELADIVKDEVDNLVRKGEIYAYYYILLDGKIYPAGYKYNKEVEEGKRSANDIYAYVDVNDYRSFDDFLFHIDYLETTSVENIVDAYLRKMGFTITDVVFPPAPNLKYYIYADVNFRKDKPQYLGVDIYDVDTVAKNLGIPQVVEQKLGSQQREITKDDAFNIYEIVTKKQPLLAGYTYKDAYGILLDYLVFHKEKYKDEARKLVLAYMNLFPTPYQVCYEWKMEMFIRTSCLKIDLRKRLKRSS
ncbi:MAG: hypothetical protein OWT28_04800 [Firmicutes bacterium]|nr:hypothetical protein [Bacillota bacterium]